MTNTPPKAAFWTVTFGSAKEAAHLYFEPLRGIGAWLSVFSKEQSEKERLEKRQEEEIKRQGVKVLEESSLSTEVAGQLRSAVAVGSVWAALRQANSTSFESRILRKRSGGPDDSLVRELRTFNERGRKLLILVYVLSTIMIVSAVAIVLESGNPITGGAVLGAAGLSVLGLTELGSRLTREMMLSNMLLTLSTEMKPDELQRIIDALLRSAD